jgi:hypothetical protein
VTTVQVDENLKKALDAARRATDAGSFFEKSNAWNDAGFAAPEVMALLRR